MKICATEVNTLTKKKKKIMVPCVYTRNFVFTIHTVNAQKNIILFLISFISVNN